MLSSDRDGTDAPAITVTAIVKAQNVKLLEVGSTQIHVNHKPEWLLTTNLSMYSKTPVFKRHIHEYFILDLCHTTTMWEGKQIWAEVSDVLLTWH